MGPFPHDAPPATISADNPMGTDGFEFVEYAHPEPEKLHALFKLMGFEVRVDASWIVLALLLLAPGTPMQIETLTALTHPDDLPAMRERYAAAVAGARDLPAALCRIIRPGGEVRFRKPAVYQAGPNGERQYVEAGYAIGKARPAGGTT